MNEATNSQSEFCAVTDDAVEVTKFWQVLAEMAIL